MFHRRRRSASLSRPTTPASSSAQTAAAQAFRASQGSNANLSSAAAAAALRASTPSQLSVGDVQTKRMLQRQGSVSSQGSAPGVGRGSSLQRRGSGGSMTERSFRSPSPNRPSSKAGYDQDHVPPPVPPLPEKYGVSQPRNRASSVDPVSNRVYSPFRGRGASIDDTLSERPASRNSINFSRPLSPLAKSSPLSKPSAAKRSTAQNQSAYGLSTGEAANVQQAVSNAANAPVKKKKKKLATQTVQGSHLAAGGTGGKPSGTAVTQPNQASQDDAAPTRPYSDAALEQPTVQAPAPKKKKKAVMMDPTPELAPTPQPVPRASESESDTSEASTPDKRAQRASGLLNKQPSIVREDWEGEQAEANRKLDLSPVASPASQPQSRKESYAPNTTRPLVDAKSSANPPAVITTLPSPDIGTDNISPDNLTAAIPPSGRHPSVSPSRSRSARFSKNLASELTAESRHEPPPRSISPAKSAMKHPSPSSQNRSPVGDRIPGEWRLSSLTPSETSDTMSQTSADGLDSSGRRKSHRVSFETQPEVVGTVGNSHESSASTHDHRGLGLTRPATLSTIPSDDALEEVFKPRPALPSFGSVRRKRDGDIRPSTTSDSASAPSSTSSSVSNMATTMETSLSSDHAIAGLLAQDLNKKQRPAPGLLDSNEPLPPEVTSVEGTGYVSDASSNYSMDDLRQEASAAEAFLAGETIKEPTAPTKNLTEERPQIPTQTVAEVSSIMPQPVSVLPAIEHRDVQTVPQIAVQPATPGNEGGDRWLVAIPGGFPSTEFEAATTDEPAVQSREESTPTDEAESISPAPSPADVGLAEPKPPEAQIAQDPTLPPVGSFAEALRLQSQNEDESDSEGGSSIYSDAAEDLSDLEGDGFGSINAIVDSPMIPSPVQRPTASPDSPTPRRGLGEREQSWDEARAHWSYLAQRQREGKPDVAQSGPAPIIAEPLNPKPKPKKKKKTSKAPASTVVPPQDRDIVAAQPRPASLALGEKAAPTMRKSMRAKSIDDTAMRGQARPAGMKSSMRSQTPVQSAMSGPSTGMRSSMRTQAPTKPASSAPAEVKGTLQKRNIPAATAATSTRAPSATQAKAPSQQTSHAATTNQAPASSFNASKALQRTKSNDSDSSSSFKKSRRAKSMDGRHSMRRSMRGSIDVQAPPLPPAGRGGVRSLSPPANRTPFASQGTMRTSMRGSVDSTAPSLRGQQKYGGFNKTSAKGKASIVAPAVSPRMADRFKSRFGNDSDDDTPSVPKRFESRFANSDSDDDEPEPLRPVRGIPRNITEGDSTDLDDSSDDEGGRKSKVQMPSIKAEDATTLPALSMRNGSGRDLSKSSDQIASPSAEKKKGLFGRFRSKKVKDDGKIGKQLSESPARRDTHLERSQAEIENTRRPVLPSSPSSGKLQRRTMPARIMSDSWPLPPKITDDTARPSTSDGVATDLLAKETRPALAERQDTSSTLRTEGGSPILGRNGKKKRFPMLRKAFGLHD